MKKKNKKSKEELVDNKFLSNFLDEYYSDRCMNSSSDDDNSDNYSFDDDDDIYENPEPKTEPISVMRCTVSRYDKSPVSGKVTLMLYLSRKLTPDDKITVECSNDCFLPMGKCTVNNEDAAERPYAKVKLQSDYAWLEDDYSFVIFSGNEPIDVFNFNYDGKKFIYRDYHPVTRQSRESVIHEAEFQESSWNYIRKAPGTKKIINQLIDVTKLNLLNQWRKQQNLTSISFNKHFVIIDNNFVSKTCLPYLLFPYFSHETVDCNSLCESRLNCDPLERASEIFDNAENKTIRLKNVSALLSQNGNQVVQKILHNLETSFSSWSLLITGTRTEIDSLFAAYPSLKHHIPDNHCLESVIPGKNELIHYVNTYLLRHQFNLSAEAQMRVKEIIDRDYEAILLGNDAMKCINEKIGNIISGNLTQRIFNDFSESIADKQKFMSTVEANDLEGLSFGIKHTEFSDCLKELNSLIGLDELKSDIASTINKMKFQQMRRLAGFNTEQTMPNHIILTGNPGTGKTTVAKLLGKVFHSLGIISRGEVIVSERSQLVGRFIGDTEKNVNVVLQQARGNILLIDEAYTLFDGSSDDRKDFGMRVLESLLTVMSLPNPDMIVIFAGYENEMEKMLNTNPGLKGRFAHKFTFPDYTADDLTRIALNKLSDLDYKLTYEATIALKREITSAVMNKDRYFSNARWINNLIENGIIKSVADRISSQIAVDESSVSKDDLCTVNVTDIRNAMAKFAYQSHSTVRRIGFRQ